MTLEQQKVRFQEILEMAPELYFRVSKEWVTSRAHEHSLRVLRQQFDDIQERFDIETQFAFQDAFAEAELGSRYNLPSTTSLRSSYRDSSATRRDSAVVAAFVAQMSESGQAAASKQSSTEAVSHLDNDVDVDLVSPQEFEFSAGPALCERLSAASSIMPDGTLLIRRPPSSHSTRAAARIVRAGDRIVKVNSMKPVQGSRELLEELRRRTTLDVLLRVHMPTVEDRCKVLEADAARLCARYALFRDARPDGPQPMNQEDTSDESLEQRLQKIEDSLVELDFFLAMLRADACPYLPPGESDGQSVPEVALLLPMSALRAEP